MYHTLIVDDALPTRISLKKSVEDCAPLTVSGLANNGANAIGWLETYYADICITDIRMPKMDGLELLERIKRNYPWMASIVVSSYDEFAYAKKSLQLDAVDYILKPIEQPLIQEALQSAIRRLETRRKHEAVELLVLKLPHKMGMMERWVEHLKWIKTDTMPLLLADTLNMLGQWVQERFYLLPSLCDIWLSTVMEELRKEFPIPGGNSGTAAKLGGETLSLTMDMVRYYFRLEAIGKLEEGASELIRLMQGVRNEQSTKLVAGMTEYINRHFTSKLDLQRIADHVGISKNYMSTLFKLEKNTTILNYIVELRMKKAGEMLLHTNLKSYEIANRIGYDNIDYFTKLFKKHYGCTPIEYKRRMDG